MPIRLASFTALSDADLLVEVARFATCERHTTAQLVASLAELDARRLYLGRGFSSLFTYCTHALHLSEHAAYNRIEAARTARRFPIVLGQAANGHGEPPSTSPWSAGVGQRRFGGHVRTSPSEHLHK